MTATRSRDPGNSSLLAAFRGILSDVRVLQAVGQIVFAILLVFLVSTLANQIITALQSANATPNFAFLSNRAGFDLANAGEYTPDDTYWEAFNVGLRNTLSIVAAGLVGTTILGIIGGILLLSSNWLLRNITRTIVEILRNLPLVLVIIIGYFIVLSLPVQREAIAIPADGLIGIPYRYGIYLILGLILLNTTRRLPPGQTERGEMLIAGTAAAIVMIEALFWLLSANRAFITNDLLAGGIANPRLWLYLIVSLALVVFVNTVRVNRVHIFTGTLIGQLVGGLLFYFRIIPADVLRIETTPAIFLSNRGLVYPQVMPTTRFAEWIIFVVIGIVVAVFLHLYFSRVQEQTGKPQPRYIIPLLMLLALTIIGWFVVSAQPSPAAIPIEGEDGIIVLMPPDEARAAELLTPEAENLIAQTPIRITLPERQGLRFAGGEELSENYVALLITLVIYTAAFVAEIVRAGILAVPKGQIEAARALGLGQGQMLRMIVLPQALRVIIPPLTNQYLNLAKNSSLAIAIAFTDVFQVTNTIINQSGQSVTPIIMIMITYLIISLVISAFMNWVNGRFQLKTR